MAMVLSPLLAKAELMGDYVGYKACVDCHEETVAGWKTTPHAHAFETLKEQGEEKQRANGCVQCHVVAFEEDGGFIDLEMTPELVDVQCESCHGPAREHVEGDGDPDLLKKSPNADMCRACHTVGQDKNFNYEEKKQWVHKKGPEKKKNRSLKKMDTKDLSFSGREIKFGSLTEGKVAKKVVTLTNTGADPIRIINVTTN